MNDNTNTESTAQYEDEKTAPETQALSHDTGTTTIVTEETAVITRIMNPADRPWMHLSTSARGNHQGGC